MNYSLFEQPFAWNVLKKKTVQSVVSVSEGHITSSSSWEASPKSVIRSWLYDDFTFIHVLTVLLPWFIIYSIIHCYQGFRFQKTSISRSFNVFFSLNPSTANKLSTTDFFELKIVWFIRDILIIKIIIKRAKTWLWVLASTCLRKMVATFWKRSTRLLHE